MIILSDLQAASTYHVSECINLVTDHAVSRYLMISSVLSHYSETCHFLRVKPFEIICTCHAKPIRVQMALMFPEETFNFVS
jgi:hypothetical protein